MKRLSALILLTLLYFTVSAQKKNILFIAVDDLKPTIKAYHDDFAVTPNMDKLASMGYVFQNAYTQQAVCGPSRASMLTGWRPDRTKVWDLKTLIRSKNPNVVTLPQHFKENGYVTYATGKIFDPRSVDRRYDPRSWSIPYKHPHRLPHNYQPEPLLGNYQSEQHRAEYKFVEKLAKAQGLSEKQLNNYMRKNFKPSTEKADVPDNAYYDGWIAEDAVKKIDQFANSKKPFLLMVGFKKPHLPFVAPKKYWDLYDENKIKLAPFQKHAKGSPDIAYHNNGELRSYTDIPKAFDQWGLLKPEKQRELIHGYYASTSYIDALIGRLIEELKKKELLDNTIIVLWGDHGWHLGDHGLWAKHTNFEQATRLPLIIYDPSKKPGETEIPVETLDIYPTLCELAGIKPASTLQGKSLVPLLDGKDTEVKYAVSQWPKLKNGMGYTVRTKRYRYTEWYENYRSTQPRDPKKLVARELYDYKEDPLETKSLVKNKKYADVLAEHEKLLHDFLDSQVGTDMIPGITSSNFMKDEIPGKPKGTPIRQIVAKNFDPDSVFIGCTVANQDIPGETSDLLAQQFSYTTPANAAKQSAVHPTPDKWDWSKINKIIKFAEKNDMVVRLHGPISPQASKWAKEDNRTPEELMQNMTEYMTAQCKKFQKNKTVKWMDVVNETVDKGGKWFGPKPGVDQWENPWLKIGLNKDGIPIYIVKAFEIATKNADPDIKLVYNQHLTMEPAVWEKVKSTVMYLKKKGLRVDGIGWQAHLKENDNVGLDPESLKYFGELIDWTHKNGMEFHVTEIDYAIKNGVYNEAIAKKQALAYTNVLKVLLSKRHSGVVTYNIWGLRDGDGKHSNGHRYIFDEKLRAKPVYYAIQKTLENPNDLKPIFEIPSSNTTFDDKSSLLKNGDFEKGLDSWISFGETDAVTGNQKSGNSAGALLADRSGLKQKVKVKPHTDYILTGWVKSENNEPVRVKIMFNDKSRKDVSKVIKENKYTKVEIKFNSGNSNTVTVAVTKWNSGNSPAYADNFYLADVKTLEEMKAAKTATVSGPVAKSLVDDGKNLIPNGGFEKGMAPWKRFGDAEIVSDGNQHSGNNCLGILGDKTGANQTIRLKPNTNYELSGWVKSSNNERVSLTVKIEGQKPIRKIAKEDSYKKLTLTFNTGNQKEVKVSVSKWNAGDSPAWADDIYLKKLD
jgi:arylsulfatase A-like enzyme/GH35 family endo-1,4-beta-xylanase/acylphosphatase